MRLTINTMSPTTKDEEGMMAQIVKNSNRTGGPIVTTLSSRTCLFVLPPHHGAPAGGAWEVSRNGASYMVTTPLEAARIMLLSNADYNQMLHV